MLEVRGLSKSFGRLKAVDDVSLTVAGGECLGVIGPNGSGKSTLFDLLTGVTPADAGSVVLAGQEIGRATVEARVALGLARAFQAPKPFASLTVREHLELAAIAGAGMAAAPARARADEVLALTGLGPHASTLGRDLRLLDRKRLELAKALATGPKVLLLDEVSGGLTEPEVREMSALIARLKTPDLAILWVEHIAHALMGVCDRILMLHLGRKMIEDTPEVVSTDPLVRELYLGAAAHA